MIDFLYSQPIIEIDQVTKNLKITFPTANSLVKEFTNFGILKESTGYGRNRRWRLQEYLN